MLVDIEINRSKPRSPWDTTSWLTPGTKAIINLGSLKPAFMVSLWIQVESSKKLL